MALPDTTGPRAIKRSGTPRVSNLSCYERNTKYKCEDLRKKIAPNKRHLVLSCKASSKNIYQRCAKKAAIGALSGISSYGATQSVVTTIGTVGLTSILATGAVAIGGVAAVNFMTYHEQQCYENIEYKRNLLKPVGFLHGEDYARSQEKLPCIEIERKNRLAIKMLAASIHKTKKDKKNLEEAMSRDPANDRRRAHLKRMYFKKTELTKGEEKFKTYVRDNYVSAKRYSNAYTELLRQYPCINDRVIKEYLCSTVGFAIGGFAGFLTTKGAAKYIPSLKATPSRKPTQKGIEYNFENITPVE